MPLTYLAQFQLAPLLTPENIAVIMAGIGAIVAAGSYMVRSYAYVVRLRAEVAQITAQSDADDTKSENEQMSALIQILGTSTETQREFKTELVLLRKANTEGDERVADALHANAAQTQALRQDLKAWPEAVSGSIANLNDAMSSHDAEVQDKLINLETSVGDLKKRMDITEANNVILNTMQVMLRSREADSAKIAAMHHILNKYDGPPPTQPTAAASKTASKIVNADAGDASAAKPDAGQKIA